MNESELQLKAVAESLTNDDGKPYMRALWEYKQNPVEALKKYPHFAEKFAKDTRKPKK